MGIGDGINVTRDIVKINLNQQNEITTEEQVPTIMTTEASAAIYDNTVYVIGIGVRYDEIWKYRQGWKQCASLVRGGRWSHSAAFIDEVLYICGGLADSVEAFNAVTNKCTKVGKLVHAVYL